jgi:hypothetical protein
VVRPPLRHRVINRLASIDLRPRTLLAKVPFVVLVIGSLGVGLGVTLWLSTDSAERSYQLGNAREENRVLLQQKESLERDVLEADAAPALAEAARNLGMIPSKDTAHLVQDPAGNWVVVGSPKPAEGAPPPPLNTKLPETQPTPPDASSTDPTASPVEVPVRPLPRPGESAPATPGTAPGIPPHVLLRGPDGSTTLGAEHLPGDAGPPAAGPPDPAVPDAPLTGPPPGPPPGQLVGPPPESLPGQVAAPPPAEPPNAEQFSPTTAATPGAAR